MKFTLTTIVLVLTLNACASTTEPGEVRPDSNDLDATVADAHEFEPDALPAGEVRGGANMTEHAPVTLLRALLLPVEKKPSCTADASVNPSWAHCGRYELTDCTGGVFGFSCDIVVDDLSIGSLTSRMSGDTWAFAAHWGEQFVEGVRDGDGAVVVVHK